jgi:hypothetical protein
MRLTMIVHYFGKEEAMGWEGAGRLRRRTLGERMLGGTRLIRRCGVAPKRGCSEQGEEARCRRMAAGKAGGGGAS